MYTEIIDDLESITGDVSPSSAGAMIKLLVFSYQHDGFVKHMDVFAYDAALKQLQVLAGANESDIEALWDKSLIAMHGTKSVYVGEWVKTIQRDKMLKPVLSKVFEFLASNLDEYSVDELVVIDILTRSI